ncbi:MAG: TIGR04219 family outer membrane beta-barrel protein [Halofilum sp. (in: g-proteobacteria)]
MSRSPRNTLLPAALALTLAPASAFAEVIPGIDIYGKAGQWGASPSGTISSGDDDIDVEDELNFDRNDTTLLELGFEHPVPLIPNLRLRHVDLSDSANGHISHEFNGVVFDEDVHSTYDLKMTDATFYYSPLDNWVSLDLGITARHLDAAVEIDSRATSTKRADGSVELTIPMGYAAVRFDAPMTGLYASGEIQAISYDDHKMQDVRAVVGWQPVDLLSIEAGYQQLSLEFDDDDLAGDLEFDGPFVAASLRF